VVPGAGADWPRRPDCSYGRRGSFVLHHRGIARPDGSFVNDGFVVAGSATGELAGLRGTGRIAVAADGTHHLTLDYELAPTKGTEAPAEPDTDVGRR
jgi:hypothetical protein